MFDKDGDGEISIRELTTVMRSLGLNPTESEIVEIMANLDLDGSYVVLTLCQGGLFQIDYHVILKECKNFSCKINVVFGSN